VTDFRENKIMYKKWMFYSGLIALIGYLSFGFKPINKIVIDNQQEELQYVFPTLDEATYVPSAIPFTGKFFIAFKEAVGFKESNNHYSKVNTLGYMGKYQFGASTLKTVGVHDSSNFLGNPKLQEKAFVALIKRNKSELSAEIKKYSGKTVGGVKVTESGILAAAHLGGAGSVKKFLKSNGTRQSADAYGSTVKGYMKKFGGYETKNIKADKNARVRN
jgi:hypothetical protein